MLGAEDPSVKGQFIQKGHFGVFNSSKNELENFNFCSSLLGQNFFVCFLEELKTPKRLTFSKGRLSSNTELGIQR